MSKKQKQQNTNYSKEMFDVHQTKLEKQIAEIQETLALFEREVYFRTTEKTLKIQYADDLFLPVNPKYSYERELSWAKYLKELEIHVQESKIAKAVEEADKLERELKVKQARLKLVREGIPAWEYSEDQL